MIYPVDAGRMSRAFFLILAGFVAACSSEPTEPGEAVSASIRSFEASPERLEGPGTVTLSWATKHAASLGLTRDGTAIELEGPVSAGTIQVELAETSTFELTATGKVGDPARARLTVVVEEAVEPPSIGSFTGPAAVALGESGAATATLRWEGVERAAELLLEVSGESPIAIDPDLTPDGSIEVEIREETEFALVASNAAGEARRSLTVGVLSTPVIEDLRADRSWVGIADPVEISWVTSNASAVELWIDGARYEGLDPAQTTGSAVVFFNFSSEVELRASNEAGGVVTSALEIEVAAPAVIESSASASSLWLGETLTVSWASAGAQQVSVTADGVSEPLCHSTDWAVADEGSCDWQPPEGEFEVTVSFSNGSGVASATFLGWAGTGPRLPAFWVSAAQVTVGDEVEIGFAALPDPAGEEPTLALSDDRGNHYPVPGQEGSLRIPMTELGVFEFRMVATTDHPLSTPAERSEEVFVHGAPAATLVASPEYFDEEDIQEVSLLWTSEHAARLVLYELVGGNPVLLLEIPEERRAAGEHRIVPTKDATFRLVATNPLEVAVEAEASISLAPPKILAFTADKTEVAVGEPVLLSWTTSTAEEVTLDFLGSAYVRGESQEPYVDISRSGGTHLPLGGDCNPSSPLVNGCVMLAFPDSFSFPFDGALRTEVRIHNAGFLSFDVFQTLSSTFNSQFPTAATYEYAHIAPFWDSLTWDAAKYPEGNLHFLLGGDEASGRTLTIQWTDATHSSNRAASLNFQVILHEDGRFEYRYGDMDPGIGVTEAQREYAEGKSATIGYQTPTQSSFDVIQHNTLINVFGLLDGRTFTYAPPQAVERSGSYLWHPFAAAPTAAATLQAARGTLSDSEVVTIEFTRRPEISMTDRPAAPVPVGTPFRLGWKTRHADSLVVLDGAGTPICTAADLLEVEEGFCPITESVEGLYEYSIRVGGERGVFLEKPARVTVSEPFEIVSFTVDRERIEVGEPITLSWETRNAAQLSLLANGQELLPGGPASGPGSRTISDREEDTTFLLRATSPLGLVLERRIDVEVWSVRLDLSPSATRVRPGEAVTVGLAATAVGAGPAPDLFGTWPMAEVENPPPYQDISLLSGAQKLAVAGGGAALQTQYAAVVLPEGFEFPFFGEAFRILRVFNVGLVSFETPTAHENNRLLPDSGSTFNRYHLAPFWDAIVPNQIDGGLWTAQTDTNTFVIQWKNYSSMTGSQLASPSRSYSLNFQVALFRDGTFEYRYGPMTPPADPTQGCQPSSCANEANGSSATIGYQAWGGTVGLTQHFGGATSGLDNSPYPGGLSNRVLRYAHVPSGGQVTIRPTRTSTYTFCASSPSKPLCKEVRVEAPFAIDSFAADQALIDFGAATTLRWRTTGGTRLRILDEAGVELASIVDTEVIDEGSFVVSPSNNATYTLELTAADLRSLATTRVEVRRFSLSSTAPATAHPGQPIALSWTLTSLDPGLQPVLITPMEEVTGTGNRFSDLDISNADGTQRITFASATATPRIAFESDFSFDYLGTKMSSVGISPNGALTFDSATGAIDANNAVLPNQGSTGQRLVHLAPFWDQLRIGSSARAYMKRTGPDTYVIQWSRFSVQTGSTSSIEYDLNFMVVLHRGGDFEFRYGTMQPPASPSLTFPSCNPTSCVHEANGSMATIGYQDPGGQVGFTLNYGSNAMQMKSVAGGLSGRSWRYTRTSATTGTVQVAPWNTTSYRVCALDPASGDSACSPAVDVEARWGIAGFDATPEAALPSETVRLSWEVLGLDRLRLLGDGVVLLEQVGASIDPVGSFDHLPGKTTTYVLEATSAGRVLEVERLVEMRSFSMEFTAPAGPFFPGEEVILSWDIVTHEAGDLSVVPPPGELGAAPGPSGTVKVEVGAVPLAHTLCAELGAYQACRTITLHPVASPGDLAITELMIDPAGSTANQWFEVRNLRPEPIDLAGFELATSRSQHVIAGPLLLEAGAYAVFASSSGAIPELAPDHVYGQSLELHPRVDTLQLIAGNSTIASARWDSGWDIPRGGTLSLDASHHLRGISTHPFGSWCEAAVASPGARGVGCRSAFYDVDAMGEGTYYDLSLVGTQVRAFETASQVVELEIPGFDWPLFDERVQRIWVAGNGWVSFSDQAPTSGSSDPPSSGGLPRAAGQQPPGPLVAGFWSTLRCDPFVHDCAFRYRHGDFGGKQALILDWSGFRYSTLPGGIDFQIQLWEDGDVKVVFGEVWSADPPGSHGHNAYHGNAAIIYLEGTEAGDYVLANLRRAIDLGYRTFHFMRK